MFLLLFVLFLEQKKVDFEEIPLSSPTLTHYTAATRTIFSLACSLAACAGSPVWLFACSIAASLW
jgi:hypothetical protein